MDTRGVIVVGAGLAGLTAGLRLARMGVPVTVLDRRGQPGGRARSTARDGFVMNLGPHGLATGGPGTAILEELGIDLTGGRPPVHRAKLLRDGQLVGPLDRRAGAGGLRTLAGMARLVARARTGDPDGSVRSWIDANVRDQRARDTTTVLARLGTYADALDEQAADVLAEAIRGGGVRYLDGGWSGLVERLQDAVVTAGAEVRAGVRVLAVGATTAGWRVVLGNGTELDAAAVIIAAGGPADAARILDGAASDVLDGWASRAAPVRMAALDVALAHRPDAPSLVLGIDEPLYLSVQSDASRIAPPGGAVIQVARFLPLGGHAPVGTRERLERLLDQVATGWRDEVVHARYLPELTVTHDGGQLATGGRRRGPGPAVPGARCLYVAGDWVGTRGTLAQASIVSGSQAATAAAGDAATAERGPDPEEQAA